MVPADEAGSRLCAGQDPGRGAGHAARARLQHHRARWRRAGRRGEARPRLRRHRGRDRPCAPGRAAVPDVKVARAAADAAIDGLAFFRGIPGAIGGALRMNAGAHGGETRDVLIEARGVDRDGTIRTLRPTPRWASPTVTVQCRLRSSSPRRGSRGGPAILRRSSPRWTASRRPARPRSRSARETGGSTFKNPEGHKAWQLIDPGRVSGPRHRRCPGVGDALQLPHQPRPGVGARHRGAGRGGPSTGFRDASGVSLEWEIKRVGVPEQA